MGFVRSVAEIRDVIGNMLAQDPALIDTPLSDETPNCPARQAQGFQKDILDLEPNQALAVVTRYHGQPPLVAADPAFHRRGRLADMKGAQLLAACNSTIGMVAKFLATPHPQPPTRAGPLHGRCFGSLCGFRGGEVRALLNRFDLSLG